MEMLLVSAFDRLRFAQFFAFTFGLAVQLVALYAARNGEPAAGLQLSGLLFHFVGAVIAVVRAELADIRARISGAAHDE